MTGVSLWLHGRPPSEKEASGKEASGPDPERVRPRPAEEPAGMGRQDAGLLYIVTIPAT